jgi:hypothetical protein
MSDTQARRRPVRGHVPCMTRPIAMRTRSTLGGSANVTKRLFMPLLFGATVQPRENPCQANGQRHPSLDTKH